jgi:hypothetical protein
MSITYFLKRLIKFELQFFSLELNLKKNRERKKGAYQLCEYLPAKKKCEYLSISNFKSKIKNVKQSHQINSHHLNYYVT